MNQLEWAKIEDMYKDEFGSPMRGERWRKKFGRLEFERMEAAIHLYGEESNSRPTVKDIIRCLPKGMVRSAQPDHLHAWDELPLEHEQPGQLVWCNTCGAHNRLRCGCKRCQCLHVSRRRISPRWYECSDCCSAIRAKGDDPDVPF